MTSPNETTPVGQTALIAMLGLRVPSPAVTSVVGPGPRRTIVQDGRTVEKYAPVYRPEDSLAGHLKFALKYEPVELGVLAAAFQTCKPDDIAAWIRAEPTGAYSRRAWFLYEWLTGKTLDVPDAGAVAYTAALNGARHITAEGIPSKRHKVTDNILGRPGFAPTVRRTPRLEAFRAEAIDAEARAIIAGSDLGILARAVTYLFTKETKSSFAIEGETAGGQRAERFVAALRSSKSFEPTDPASLLALQHAIVDPRYAAQDIRDFQTFVGETVGGYREVVHFICPKPGDVRSLMSGWAETAKRLRGGVTDPVVAAALVSFGFVFIHPFEDGNGRIHRYLIHHVLAEEGFTPPDILFPVSAAIVRDRRGYDATLETFSKTIQPFVDWHWTPGKEVVVENDTANLYRYFDATALAEFLYAKVAETVRKDLKEELGFVALYDGALSAVGEHIDMPDRRASLFVRLCLQNGGLLPKKRRGDFTALTDDEVTNLQSAIREIMDEQSQKTNQQQ